MDKSESTPNKDPIISILEEFFPGNWYRNGPYGSTQQNYWGEEVLGPASLFVDLPSYTKHWVAAMGDSLAETSPSNGMAEIEELAERGILPGSVEELREVLTAFQFSLGQVIEEMRRAHVKAVGHEHVYKERSDGR